MEVPMGLFSSLFGGAPQIQPTPVRTAAEFDAVVRQSPLPVVVDVWSETCPPCRKLWPVLVEVATRHQGRVRVVEISTTAEPRLLHALDVMATPTILVWDGGEEVGRTTGFKPRSWFDEMIEVEFGEAG